jgi:hypothetical protein
MTARSVYRVLSILGDVKAARRGPDALGRRMVRRQAHKTLASWLRKVLKP